MSGLLGSRFPASRRRVWWERVREAFNRKFNPFIIWLLVAALFTLTLPLGVVGGFFLAALAVSR